VIPTSIAAYRLEVRTHHLSMSSLHFSLYDDAVQRPGHSCQGLLSSFHERYGARQYNRRPTSSI